MKILKLTTQFKKDLKRYQNNHSAIHNLKDVLFLLKNDRRLPAKYKKHPLTGQYSGCLECYIENDTLLIWIDAKSNIIKLVRFGSHSELF